MNTTTSRPETLFLQLGPSSCRYLCAASRRGRLVVTAYGEAEGPAGFAEIRQRLRGDRSRARQVVLLLPRSELDVNVFELPAMEESGLPSVVQNLVAARSEAGGDDEMVTDFLVSPRSGSGGMDALAWSLPSSKLRALRDDARRNGFQLRAVTFQGLGAYALWRQIVTGPPANAAVFAMNSQAIEISVIRKYKFNHIRSIPFQYENDQELIDRLVGEYRRTLAVIVSDPEKIREEAAHIYLFGRTRAKTEIGKALTSEFGVSVSILSPLEHVDLRGASLAIENCDDAIHLLGIASQWSSGPLMVDLCHPRNPQSGTLPWRRVALWSCAAAALLVLGGTLTWDSIARSRAELEQRQLEYQPLLGEARQVLEMQDELATIREWRRNEVVWLDRLNQLTESLPPREQSLLRRISMSTPGDGSASMDLTVEVNQAELVVGLENAIRTDDNNVTSKRVSESSDGITQRWSFETKIQFPVVPPRLSLQLPAATGETASGETASGETASGETASGESSPGTTPVGATGADRDGRPPRSDDHPLPMTGSPPPPDASPGGKPNG